MGKILQAVRGMNDILPQEAEFWEDLETCIVEGLQSYGYRQIRLPLVEQTALFHRAIGKVTDIVEKEMYSFEDALNGEQLTLRPEGTASCVRAAIEHKLLYSGPQRLYYIGPMFRHERPQRGRYRQFHQIGVEALGFPGPDIDAELILMSQRLWSDLGLEGIRLEINSLGNTEERGRHRSELIAYFEQHQDQLDEDGRRRLHTNPLRILDTKNPQMQALVEAAPRLLDFMGTASLAHFERLQQLLKDTGVNYCVNPRLVRGLDYYNLTVFEWVTDKLGAQGTICAGGRYDGLVEQLGGKPAPAAGFALGLERLLALWRDQGVQPSPPYPDAYMVSVGDMAQRMAFHLADQLRELGFSVINHCGGGSFKSQMKKADSSGAIVALLIGEDEVATSQVMLKALRHGGEQYCVGVEDLEEAINIELDIVFDQRVKQIEDSLEKDEQNGSL